MTNYEQIIWLGNPKFPYNVSIPVYLTLVYHLRSCRWTSSKILAPKCVKISQNRQNRLLEGLKSWYCQLWADYLIRNPKTPYNVSIPCYPILYIQFGELQWTSSQIVGLKVVNISQNGHN